MNDQANYATIDLKRLIQARGLAAHVVQECGEWALPIFDRLDREVQDRENRAERLQKALEINTASTENHQIA